MAWDYQNFSSETVKTSEGDNTEQTDGFIKVWFGNQVEVK